MVYVMLARLPNLYRHVLLVCALTLGAISVPQAHPHMWVDLRSHIIVQDDGKVAALYQEWLFDDFFSQALMEDAAKHPDGVEAGITLAVEDILHELRAYDYFTRVSLDEQNIATGTVEMYAAELRGKRVWMSFTVPVVTPADIQTQSLSYAIFDPTYFMEMLHFENEIVTIQGNAPDGCGAQIIDANPSADAIALSQSSSLDDNPDDTIGRLFAQNVVVRCP